MPFIFENSKNSLFYIDPADIETRKEEFKVFLKDNSDFIDILSINENECFSLLSSIGISYPKDDLSDEKGLKSISKTLAEAFEIDINIHTRMGSVWSNGKETEFAYSYPAEPNIITGAGDTWDAANLLGYLTDMEPSERLDFANLIASLYLESTGAIPPDIEYLKLHLKNIY